MRAEARALGLAVADKPESMEVCFVPDGDAAGFVERAAGPAALRPGAVVDETAAALGAHDGVHRFTVGQRRGLGAGRRSAALRARDRRRHRHGDRRRPPTGSARPVWSRA